METRYTGEPTLDEPVSATIVSSVLTRLLKAADPARCGTSAPFMPSFFKCCIRLKVAAATSCFAIGTCGDRLSSVYRWPSSYQST